MAKKKKRSGVNKSELIRDYLGANPGAANKDVAAALSSKGVTSQDVANLKTRLKSAGGAKPGKKSAVKKKKRKAAGVAGKAASVSSDIELSSVEAAADFVAAMGGVGAAQQAINAAAEIAKKLK